MASLQSRIETLEKRLESLEKMEPSLVFFVGSEQEQSELKALHAGKRLVFVVTTCGRIDCNTCQTPGGIGCRNKEATAWQQ